MPIQSVPFFTVYQTAQGIALRAGCQDYMNWQAIHSSKSYESAYRFAQIAAAHRAVPFDDYVKAERISLAEEAFESRQLSF